MLKIIVKEVTIFLSRMKRKKLYSQFIIHRIHIDNILNPYYHYLQRSCYSTIRICQQVFPPRNKVEIRRFHTIYYFEHCHHLSLGLLLYVLLNVSQFRLGYIGFFVALQDQSNADIDPVESGPPQGLDIGKITLYYF